MDRSEKNRVGIHIWIIAFWLAALLFVTTNYAVAESYNGQQSPAQTKTKSVNNVQSAGNNAQAGKTSDSAMNKPNELFPQLERALVITTIVNLVIIVFMLLLYSAKRKMNQFSPVPLANIKQEYK